MFTEIIHIVLYFLSVANLLAVAQSENGGSDDKYLKEFWKGSDSGMTWIIIAVVAAVALTLGCVFGTYCCGGWCPNWWLCFQRKVSDDVSETATLITQPLKNANPLENILKLPKPNETSVIANNEQREVPVKPFDNLTDETKLDHLLP